MSEDDVMEKVADEILSSNLKTMDNGLLKLDWANVKSAIVYGVMTGVAMSAIYAYQVGDIFTLDWKLVVNSFVFGFLGSVIKNLLTTNKGNFLGIMKVVPETK